MQKQSLLFKFLLCLLFIVMIKTNSYAQTGLNFQGVARSSNNVIIASQQISLRLSILQGSSTGSVEYSETRKVTTNAQGLFAVVIGDADATSTMGIFNNINWKNTPKFLKIEMDANAGNNYTIIGTTQFQYVAYAQFASSVDAENIAGIVPVNKGGTGVSSITALKTALSLDKINNTADADKSISTKTQTALDLKLNAADTSKYTKQSYTDAALLTKFNLADTGKYTKQSYTDSSLITKLKLSDTASMLSNRIGKDTLNLSARINAKANTSDVNTAMALKANASDVTTSLSSKVDKVTGKELSTNDYSNAEKAKLAAITGTNTGDQDLSSYATNTTLALKANTADVNTSLALKANASDVTTSLSSKVDKISGKELSTNDYSNAEKAKLAAITGTNTGDQDLSSYATNTTLALKANTADVNTSLALKANVTEINTALLLKANASDVTTSLGLKENISNKSSAADLGGTSPSDILYPTQKAVKDYVTANASSGGVADGGITTIKLADGAVTDAKLATGISKSKVGLGNVENTALSTWAGSNNLTTVGAITSGTWSGTAIPLNNGGTGATNAAQARANLGLVIGTDVQAPLVAGTDYQIPLTAGTSYIVPNSSITAKTKIKITYDSKGLITAGSDATTADIAPSTDRNYVTDVQSGVISNTSGVNTGDETTSTIKSKLGITTLSGSNTGDQTNVTGNAGTATKLATARKINNVDFDGSGDIIITAIADAGTLTGITLNPTITESSLTTVGTINSGTWSGTAIALSNGGTGATNATAARANLGLVIGANVQAPLVAGTDYQIPLIAGTNYIVPNSSIAGATKTKITYDTKGLITGGADATTADITPSTDRNYVTDVQSGVISNTSGVNTGDETTSSIKSKLGITTLSGSNTGDQTNVTGNAGTATKLVTARNINDVPFDGTSNITITADAGTLSGTTLNSTVTGSSLTSVGTLANLTVTNPIAGSITGNAATAGNITATSNTTLTSVSNLNTVGTITSGVWSGTTVAVEKGGTGLTSAGTAGQVLTSTGRGTLVWQSTTPTLSIGDVYQGGIVAYILQAGDPGFDATIQKGIIAASSDQSTGIRWYNGNYTTTGATGTAIGSGLSNTNTIITSQGAISTSYAAGLARAYTEGGYTDWYLPSKDELNKLYLNRTAIGGFAIGSNYWSSTEGNVNLVGVSSGAWFQSFYDGYQGDGSKNYAFNVRAIRAFSSVKSIEDGGTGATTASAARTNLGLEIGTNVQAPLVAGTDYQIPLTAGTSYIVPNSAITAATKTKITYDTKGLITAGADATTADIAPSTDRNYVTDAQKSGVLSNTSGINTGDQTITLTGDVTGASTGIITATLTNSGVTAGSYGNATSVPTITVDAKGRITAAGTVSVTSTGVPYTGATGAVNLGAYDLRVNGLTVGLGGGAVSGNTAIGYQSLYSNTTGYNNTAVGGSALDINKTGYNNTAIGYGATTNLDYHYNATAIGYGAIVTASNRIQLGNTNVTSVKTNGKLISGTVTYPNTDGTNGQFLATDGAGNVNWVSNVPVASTVTLNVTPFVLANLSVGGVNYDANYSKMNYMKMGNMVFFSGSYGLISTSGSSVSSFNLPLPIASAFTNSMDAVGIISTSVGVTGTIEANTGSTKYLNFKFRSDVSKIDCVIYFSGSYIIK